jgi:predicted TIM-barrel fold metal-dependent hydrolase
MIIDSHCHAGKGDGLTGPWDTDAPLGAYLRRAARAGISRSVLFAAFSSDYRAANAEVGRIVVRRPERFYGYAMVNAARDAGRVGATVEEALTGWGACGIKIHRHDARISREVCEVARSFALPVLYDVMGEAFPMELVAVEYPDVDFVIPHLGSFADDWRAQRAVIDLLARHANVYTDTSGVRRFDLLAEAVRRAGPQKVLFGTDGPWLHPAVELSKVHALGLPPAQENLVLGANWLRLTAASRSRARAQARLRPVSASRVPLTRSTAAARLLRPGSPQSHALGPIGDRDDPWAADQFPADHLS